VPRARAQVQPPVAAWAAGSAADLVPDAKWLAQEVPSAPVVKLLREYIPGLPVRLQVNGKTLPPPDRVLNQLRDAVSKRNQLTHRGVNRVDGQFLKETIYAVSDCLRLLDYYSGHSWALNWLSWETMQDLHVAPRR